MNCLILTFNLLRFLTMIIDNLSNQIILITFFKENIPSRSVIRFIKNVVGA